MEKRVRRTQINKLAGDVFSIVFGAFLCAFALYSFIIPGGFVSGGVGGIATLLEVGGVMKSYNAILIMNAPLFLAALIWLKKEFAVKTITCTMLISVIMSFMDKTGFMRFTEDRLLAAVYSGIIYGVGLGMQYLCGGSTGGSEIVANLIVKRNPEAKVATLIMIMDVIVILVGLVLFDIWSVAYAVICSVACEKSMDFYIGRGRRGDCFFLISGKPERLGQALTDKFGREGITVEAVGSTTGGAKTLYQLFLPPGSINRVKDVILEKDDDAFAFVLAAGSTGRGNKIK